MDALQEPPRDHALDLPIIHFEARAWYRVHHRDYTAVYFDREPTYRFNAPDAGFGVMYMSESAEGSFAETLLRRRVRPLRLTQRALHERALTELMLPELRFADFTSLRLSALGLDARIASDNCYELAQRWAGWVHAHPANVDGICYLARQAPGVRSVALFERAPRVLLERCLAPSFLLSSGTLSTWGARLLDVFAVGVLPDSF